MPLTFSRSANAYDPRTVGDWWNLALAGRPRPLAPGWYIHDEPLETDRRIGLRFVGPSVEWTEPVGWNRAWASQADNASAMCMIGFDDSTWDAGTPCIAFSGCRGVLFEGISLFRDGAGSLVHDTNISGWNSAQLRFKYCGFGTRYDAEDSTTDTFAGGLGILSPNNAAAREGYVGVEMDGTNGTDSVHFTSCVFSRLEIAYLNYSPQTTRAHFIDTFWRDCEYSGWFDKSLVYTEQTTGSGSVSCWGCSHYDTGPFVYKNVARAVANMSWVNGWRDYNGSAEEYKPLVDCSAHSSWCAVTYLGSCHKSITPTPTATTANSLVIRKTSAPTQTQIYYDAAGLTGTQAIYTDP